jgi:hypothetical protein
LEYYSKEKSLWTDNRLAFYSISIGLLLTINSHNRIYGILNIYRNWPKPYRLKYSEETKGIYGWNINNELNSRENNIKPNIDLFGNIRKENTNLRLKNHTKLIMPIITPVYPEQSAAFNVNYSTRKIIQETLFNGEGFF